MPTKKTRGGTMGKATVTISDPEFINVKEAAALLRLSEISIRRLLWKKQLKRFKAGGRTLVKRSQVLSIIREA